jgi:hypothetical protein
MKTTNLLITSAFAALMAATGPSMAQQDGVPHRERTSPAEKMAPQGAPGTHNPGRDGRAGEAPQHPGRPETTGQVPREEQQGRPGGRNTEQERGRTERLQKEQERTTGQAPREERPGGGLGRDRTTGQAPKDDLNGPSRQNKAEQERERIERSERGRETTGQAGAGARSYNLTPENRTRIHEFVVRERNAPRVDNPHFDVSIGTRVPRDIRFVAVPQTIIEIEPAWRGFEYFMIGDRMVVIKPRTMEIVAIVDV